MSAVKKAGKCLFGVCLTAAFATASAAEPVGTLSRIEGATVVSQGAQYVKGREGMKLREGDRLMAMEGGNAVISFADGCQYTLTDSELLTLGPTSPCASDAVGSHKVDPYAAVSQDPSVASATFQQAQAVGSVAGISWVVPAVIVGGLAIAAAASDTGSDNSRAFPRPSISP